MAVPPENGLSSAELADVCALADGSIDPERRAAVHEKVNASPVLRELYEQERRAVEVIRVAGAAQRAPHRLRAEIDAMYAKRPARSRWTLRYGVAVAAASVAAAVVLALVLPAGTPGSPSVSQAASLATRGPKGSVPGAAPTHSRTELARDVQGVYFPNWSASLGWRAVGQRSDMLGGRPVVTVYYRWHGKRVAYSIVGGSALPQPRAGVVRLNGFEIRTLASRGRAVVTWRRSGHTCVLSGKGVSPLALRQLAAWRSSGISG